MRNQTFIILRTENTKNKRYRESGTGYCYRNLKISDDFCMESRTEVRKFEKAMNLKFRCVKLCTMSFFIRYTTINVNIKKVVPKTRESWTDTVL